MTCRTLRASEMPCAAGCRVVNMPIDIGDLAQTDPVARAANVPLIRRWIDAAAALGSAAVRVNTGRAGEQSESAAFANATEGYREVAAYCAEGRLTLLLENH